MTNKGQLTRELGVSGSVSDSRAEGEVGRSDILGPAFSEKSATYFDQSVKTIRQKNRLIKVENDAKQNTLL